MKDPTDFEVEPFGAYHASGQGMELEVIPTVDTRVCVPDTTVAPFPYVCSLDDGSPFCSGTLIGPRTVLTAGHCIDDRLSGDPGVVRVIPGRNDRKSATPPFGVAPAAGFVLAPDHVQLTTTDYGVVVLRDPIGNKVGWWTFDPFRFPGDPIGTSVLQTNFSAVGQPSVHISGYPCDRPFPPSPPPTIPPVPPESCFVAGKDLTGRVQYEDTNQALSITPEGILEYLNDTFHCMSGSPVWFERPPSQGGRCLLAVHISGDLPPAPRANRGILIRGTVREFVRVHAFYPPGAAMPPRATVRYLSKGVDVREVQYRVNIWITITPAAGLAALKVDGSFGPKTLAGVRAFQKGMGLVADGIVGPITWGRLRTPF